MATRLTLHWCQPGMCGPSKWPTHAQRRLRRVQQLEAALSLARSQRAILDALADNEINSRLQIIAPCLAAQQRAADIGISAHSSRRLVSAEAHVRSTGAKHIFSTPIARQSPQLVRREQRGRRKATNHSAFTDIEQEHIAATRAAELPLQRQLRLEPAVVNRGNGKGMGMTSSISPQHAPEASASAAGPVGDAGWGMARCLAAPPPPPLPSTHFVIVDGAPGLLAAQAASIAMLCDRLYHLELQQVPMQYVVVEVPPAPRFEHGVCGAMAKNEADQPLDLRDFGAFVDTLEPDEAFFECIEAPMQVFVSASHGTLGDELAPSDFELDAIAGIMLTASFSFAPDWRRRLHAADAPRGILAVPFIAAIDTLDVFFDCFDGVAAATPPSQALRNIWCACGNWRFAWIYSAFSCLRMYCPVAFEDYSAPIFHYLWAFIGFLSRLLGRTASFTSCLEWRWLGFYLVHSVSRMARFVLATWIRMLLGCRQHGWAVLRSFGYYYNVCVGWRTVFRQAVYSFTLTFKGSGPLVACAGALPKAELRCILSDAALTSQRVAEAAEHTAPPEALPAPVHSIELTSCLFDKHANEHTGMLGGRGYDRMCEELPNYTLPSYKAALRRFGAKGGLALWQVDALLATACLH
jgi:hypothetical protein